MRSALTDRALGHHGARRDSTHQHMMQQHMGMTQTRPLAVNNKVSSNSSNANSRRRKMTFMRYGSERKMSINTMHRTREHARQLAMRLSKDTSSPMSVHSTFADFGRAFPAADDNDDFGAPMGLAHEQHEDQLGSASFSESFHAEAVARSLFDEDPFDGGTAAMIMENPTRETTTTPIFEASWPYDGNTMHTMPSNMSVQARYSRRGSSSQHDNGSYNEPHNYAMQPPAPPPPPATTTFQQHAPSSPDFFIDSVPSTLSSSGGGTSGGAAARRRVRTQLRMSQRSSTIGSSHPTSTTILRSESMDSSSVNNNSQIHQTPPPSPHSARRLSAADSIGSRGGRSDNGYQRTPGSAKSASSSHSGSEPNIFDTTNPDGGFTFDAFGLDATQINREVSEAMHDIVGGYAHSDFGLADDFGRWDSPEPSRSSTPAPAESPQIGSENDDGFVDGFRVSKPLPVHVRQSPTPTERSSLTSESSGNGGGTGAGGTINLFKEKAGFHTSNGAVRKVVRPLENNRNHRLATSQHHYLEPQISHSRTSIAHVIEEGPSSVGSPRTKEDVEFFNEEEDELDEDETDEAATAGPDDSQDVILSDVGVSSDVQGNSVLGDVPLELKRIKQAKRSTIDTLPTETSSQSTQEEKKDSDSDHVKLNGVRSRAQNARSHWAVPQETFHTASKESQPYNSRPAAPSHLSEDENKPRRETDNRKTIKEPPQKERADECLEQRSSFASRKERLKSPSASSPSAPSSSPYNSNIRSSTVSVAKSEGGGVTSFRNGQVATILNRVDRQSPRETSSDTGGPSPSYADVKMSRSLPFHQSVSDPTTTSSRDPSPRSDRHATFMDEPGRIEPKETQPRALTYREKRELELQMQREEESLRSQPLSSKQEPVRDVAHLIKQRIAQNKKHLPLAVETENYPQDEDITTQRDRLRPVAVESSAASSPRHRTSPRAAISPQPLQPNQTGYLVASNPSSGSGPASAVSRMMLQQHQVISPRHPSPKVLSTNVSPNRQLAALVYDERRTLPTEKKKEQSSAIAHMLMMEQIQHNQTDFEPSSRPPLSPSRGISQQPNQRHGLMLEATTFVDPVSAAAEDYSGKGGKTATPKATMMMLNAFLSGRESISSHEGAEVTEMDVSTRSPEQIAQNKAASIPGKNSLPAIKDDPTFERYFKMLKIGMPIDVVKHAMTRDGLDASVMDCDPNKPAGIPLKDDPEYTKYFKMLEIGLPMEAVKHAMERDGLDSSVMDHDHDLPVQRQQIQKQNEEGDADVEKDSHRRARLHWKTLRKVTSDSLWAKINQDDELEQIDIDELEFQELFQAEKTVGPAPKAVTTETVSKRGATVRVIDPKRANNGGIVLARLKLSHDEMADAVDRLNESKITAEQIEGMIEYLPTKDERRALEAYMLEGGQDAAEKFDGLCECEKFMVSMMTVKHAKRKVRALLFKMQFESCIYDIQKEAFLVEAACDELFNSVRLRKLLGIILTFGNRLNTAGNAKRRAGAFTLDSLLKLHQAKAFDKKTTFLHYIVLIVQRNNELLLRFKDDLPTVFKADKVFWDQCVSDLEEVENQLENVRRISLYQARQAHSYRLRRKKKHEDDDESLSDEEISLTLEEEVESLRSTPIGMFTLSAIKYVSSLRDKVDETKRKFSKLCEYFGEEETKYQPHDLFATIGNFSRDFDKAKEQVFANEKKKLREDRKRQVQSSTRTTPGGKPPTHSPMAAQRKQGDQQKMLKVSNHQPSMAAVIKELHSQAHPNSMKVSQITYQEVPEPPRESPETPMRNVPTSLPSVRSPASEDGGHYYTEDPNKFSNSSEYQLHPPPTVQPKAVAMQPRADNDLAQTFSVEQAHLSREVDSTSPPEATMSSMRQKARMKIQMQRMASRSSEDSVALHRATANLSPPQSSSQPTGSKLGSGFDTSQSALPQRVEKPSIAGPSRPSASSHEAQPQPSSRSVFRQRRRMEQHRRMRQEAMSSLET